MSDISISGRFLLRVNTEGPPSFYLDPIGIHWFPPPGKVQDLIAIVRAVVLATATAWDCEWAGAQPGDYARRPLEKTFSKIRSNGAVLLTTVQSEIFSNEIAGHHSAAKRLQTALNRLFEADPPSAGSGTYQIPGMSR
ncbi:MAG TPA: hypothetical protein VKV77_14565 [Methylovirgula sp.]|nr:hypothetical protein [Methylovirgula sp.]